MTKIIRLQASNIKRLTAVEIQPDGSLVIVGGPNGAGKSSCLDSIMYALAGTATIPSAPVRKGERRARVVVDLDNGLRVTRTFDASGSQLAITNGEGEKQGSPQTLLNRICGKIAFDPLEYSRMDREKQAAIMRDLAKVDTRPLDHERQKLFDQRTDKNRDVKGLRARLDALPAHPDAPAEEIDVASLVAEASELQATIHRNGEQRRAAVEAREAAGKAAARVVDTLASIARLERQLEEERKLLAQFDQAEATAKNHALELEQAAAALVDPDRKAHEQRVRDAQEANKRVRANKQRAELERELTAAEALAEGLTDAIADIDGRKRAQLAAATFPVPGLGFDDDGTVTLDGVPFDQASQAQRIRVSVAIGLAMNPTLRVLLIREGSLLDERSLKEVAAMAQAADAQIWLEKVSNDGAGCSVVIEDGHVRAAEAAE